MIYKKTKMSQKLLEKVKAEKEKYFKDGDPDLPQKSVFCEFCAVKYVKEGKESKNGILRILENPAEGGRRRIIMRDSHDLNSVVLNHFVLPTAPLSQSHLKQNQISYMPVNYPYLDGNGEGVKEQIILRFVTSDVNPTFIKVFNESMEINKKLLA